MNYQLMFQTIAVLCGIATAPMFIVCLASFDLRGSKKVHKNHLIIGVIVLFTVTVISGALAAGLS